MEGRWTITKRNEDARFIRGPECHEVPVVPCDGGAVERGAAVLRLLLGEVLGTDTEIREMAWAVLRAAGETP